MKISLEEARALATQGKLLAETKEVDFENGPSSFSGLFADVYDPYQDQLFPKCLIADVQAKAKPTAALLAHCWNNFDELLAAFEAFAAATVDQYGASRMFDCGLPEAAEAIKKAKEVEI